MNLIHGTAVVLGQAGLLLRGPSGSGKSDLALRLIDEGARLVADDQVEIACESADIVMSAPSTIAGMIEARGLGILRLPRAPRAALRLVCDLVSAADVERLPERRHTTLLGISVPLFALCPFEGSAPAKLRFALQALAGDELKTQAALIAP